jgi:hypothetical protein
MKYLLFLVIMTLAACNGNESPKEPTVNPDTVQVPTKSTAPLPAVAKYSNERFKDVTVERVGEFQFLIRGKGQIFEANFGWVVEDGHMELKKGNAMTDAGAPEWGNFSFTVDVKKERENSTLMLILFESSPKDGSRQYELPVLLY